MMSDVAKRIKRLDFQRRKNDFCCLCRVHNLACDNVYYSLRNKRYYTNALAQAQAELVTAQIKLVMYDHELDDLEELQELVAYWQRDIERCLKHISQYGNQVQDDILALITLVA